MNFPFLTLLRKDTIDDITYGELYIGMDKFCDTAEDAAEMKIPLGTYDIKMNDFNYELNKDRFYKNICRGFVPHLDGLSILFNGNICKDKKEIHNGSIMVGKRLTKKDGNAIMIEGPITWMELYEKIKIAYRKGQKIQIEIRET